MYKIKSGLKFRNKASADKSRFFIGEAVKNLDTIHTSLTFLPSTPKISRDVCHWKLKENFVPHIPHQRKTFEIPLPFRLYKNSSCVI